MSTSNKLKAFVRFDGSGRVVPSSVILARFKPKVGNYHEIDAYECCNEAPTTTTTTTQGGGITPTAWVGYQSPLSLWDACNNPATTWVLYTNVDATPLPPGTGLYTDAALTTLVYPGDTMFFSINGYAYEVINGYTNPLGYGQPCAEITTTTTTTAGIFSQTAITNFNPGDACAGNGFTPILYYSGSTISIGTALYTDAGLSIPYNPASLGDYVRLYFAAQDQVCTMSGNIIFSYSPC